MIFACLAIAGRRKISFNALELSGAAGFTTIPACATNTAQQSTSKAPRSAASAPASCYAAAFLLILKAMEDTLALPYNNPRILN